MKYTLIILLLIVSVRLFSQQSNLQNNSSITIEKLYNKILQWVNDTNNVASKEIKLLSYTKIGNIKDTLHKKEMIQQLLDTCNYFGNYNPNTKVLSAHKLSEFFANLNEPNKQKTITEQLSKFLTNTINAGDEIFIIKVQLLPTNKIIDDYVIGEKESNAVKWENFFSPYIFTTTNNAIKN